MRKTCCENDKSCIYFCCEDYCIVMAHHCAETWIVMSVQCSDSIGGMQNFGIYGIINLMPLLLKC